MTLTSRIEGGGVMRPILASMRSYAPSPDDLEAQIADFSSRIAVIAGKTVLHKHDGGIGRPRFLLRGWACRYLDLYDGGRQVFDVLLPGDSFGCFDTSGPFANISVLALTPLRLSGADANPKGSYEGWYQAVFQAQVKLEQERALRQIIRLGQMSALARIADLFLELYERLKLVGQNDGASFACPLTQSTLGGMTGLSLVHVNRTLRELRRRDLIVFERGWVRIISPGALPRPTHLFPSDLSSDPLPVTL